jgi:hypothetical protein
MDAPRRSLLLDGRLLIGPKAERRFGRRNFMELYAVFSSPQTYTVETTSRPGPRAPSIKASSIAWSRA